jgi:hypothetical protein
MNYKLSRHAKEEAVRRGIPTQMVESIVDNPQQVVLDATGKRVFQSKVEFQPGKIYLVRVVIGDKADPPTVITVYRTSKIEKYWRKS